MRCSWNCVKANMQQTLNHSYCTIVSAFPVFRKCLPCISRYCGPVQHTSWFGEGVSSGEGRVLPASTFELHYVLLLIVRCSLRSFVRSLVSFHLNISSCSSLSLSFSFTLVLQKAVLYITYHSSLPRGYIHPAFVYNSNQIFMPRLFQQNASNHNQNEHICHLIL